MDVHLGCMAGNYALVENLGIPYAEIARQLGVSHVAVIKMIERIANE
jgi:DNA-binding Lrp family transcriptional regulator